MELFTRRWIGWIMICFIIVGVGGFYWRQIRQPETTPVTRGKEIAENLGCFACHGSIARRGITNPGSSGGDVPTWDRGIAAMFIERENDIREWILYGAPLRLLGDSDETDPETKSLLIPMPAYKEHLSSAELEDLVAYFRAVSWWVPSIPDVAYEGKKLASNMGCFGCHGPSGKGGIRNPGSLTGYIPPWDGADFEELVRDEDEMREWILDGSISRLEENPLSRYFLSNQKIKMPAYREHISKKQMDKLVAYIQWINNQ